jgi:cob(I)alamin adenosyltransferase
MPNRLTKIATRTGDDGSTGLGDGSRTRKNSPRVAAIGDVDELNSMLGLLAAETLPAEVAQLVAAVQHDLFDLGGELSIPGFEKLGVTRVAKLDAWLDAFNRDLPPLAEFILPGGSRPAALAHVARTICRRAERDVVALAGLEFVRPLCQKYLNRLSDLLFVLARVLNRANGGTDVLWQKDRPEP